LKKRIFLFSALDWFAGVKLTPAGVINLGYFHQKTNSPLQLGVEFDSSLAAKETSATFSYQYDLAKANTTFRGTIDFYRLDYSNTILYHSGMIDTNGLVTGVIEKRLAPLPFTFILSSSLNHAKAAYRFGIGLLIG
jgi:mitochondrial import receptor subunit TOM40